MSAKFPMYNTMINIFGKEALIINSRAHDFIGDRVITTKEISQFSRLLSDPSSPITDPITRINYIACILYYQTSFKPQVKKDFLNIELKLKDDCEINEANLFLIFNIVEFENKYMSSKEDVANSDQHKYEKLLKNINRFQNKINGYDYFLLLLYYRALLYFMLKRYTDCENETTSLVIALCDYQSNNTKNGLITFLEFANRLLTLRLKKVSVLKDSKNLNEFENLLYDIYNDIGKKSVLFAIKVGNYLADICLKKLDFKKCIEILNKNVALFDEIRNRQSLEIGKKLYEILLSLFIYCFSLENKVNEYIEAVERLSNFNIGENKPILNLLNTFLINSYLMDNDKNVINKEKMMEKINTFRLYFFESKQSPTYVKLYIPNVEVIYNNLFVLNHTNPLGSEFKKLVTSYSEKIQKKDPNILCGDPNDQTKIVNIYICIYNYISYHTYLYLNEKSEMKNKYKNTILNQTSYLVNYIHKYHINMPCLSTPLVRKMLVTLYSVYLSLCDVASFSKFINFYNNLFIGYLGITDKDKGAGGLIYKSRGDYYFYKNNYKDALNCYKKSLDLLGNFEEKYRKSVIMFNIGICYLMTKSKQQAKKFLEDCLNKFKQYKSELDYNFNGLSKIVSVEFYDHKIKIVENVLKLIG